jgi:hypothetical protein
MKSMHPHLAHFEDCLPELAAFIGCDCVPHVHGMGVAKVLGADKKKGKQATRSRLLHWMSDKTGLAMKKELWRQLVRLVTFGKSCNFSNMLLSSS